jgi:hypothetical protein
MCILLSQSHIVLIYALDRMCPPRIGRVKYPVPAAVHACMMIFMLLKAPLTATVLSFDAD